jgi:O-6-methylguanine DNA methyltransferase
VPAFLAEFDLLPKGRIVSLSKHFPELAWDVRPLGFRWLLRASGPPAALNEMRSAVRTDRSFVWLNGSSVHAAVCAYAPKLRETDVLRQVAENGGFILPPMTMKAGTLRLRLVTNHGTALSDGSRMFSSGRLVSRRRLTGPRLAQELDRQFLGTPALTARQSEVLREAVRSGYYEVPRRSTVMDVARHLSLGRSTTEEHLRIAESTVVRSAAPLVTEPYGELLGGSMAEREEHFARFSTELQLYVELALRSGRVTQVRFRRKAPETGTGRDHPFLSRILTHIRTGRTPLDRIPVKLDVGAFEQEVLEEIRRIPTGETRTYSEIARRVGRPRAVRAVGNACAHNPLVVVIPCHRVVPSHGGIGRYSGEGGTETKRRLLSKEGAIPEEAVWENHPRLKRR